MLNFGFELQLLNILIIKGVVKRGYPGYGNEAEIGYLLMVTSVKLQDGSTKK